MTTASTSTGEWPARWNRLSIWISYSAAVRWMSVERRHVRSRRSPRNSPRQMFVLPISMASSMQNPVLESDENPVTYSFPRPRLPAGRGNGGRAGQGVRPGAMCVGCRWRNVVNCGRYKDANYARRWSHRIASGRKQGAMQLQAVEILRQLATPAQSKMVLLVMDGLGGLPHEKTGLTELETAKTPNLDRLAKENSVGLTTPLIPGVTPGSAPAHLALFGYDAFEYPIGRGVLSAVGIGLDLTPNDVACRVNF